MILFGDLLGAQVLLDRHREIRPAFDSGIVGNNKDFAIADASNAGDNPSSGSLIIIKLIRCQRGEFQKRRTRIKQTFDPFADEEFALLFLSLAIFFAASLMDARQAFLELVSKSFVMFGVVLDVGEE